jgi:hypothetical protein
MLTREESASSVGYEKDHGHCLRTGSIFRDHQLHTTALAVCSDGGWSPVLAATAADLVRRSRPTSVASFLDRQRSLIFGQVRTRLHDSRRQWLQEAASGRINSG